MDTSTQELMNMLDQMKDKLKKLGMEKVALQKENNKLKKENEELKEANDFIEQVYDNTGNAHDSNEYLAEHIKDLHEFSLAYQEQWDAWSEEKIEGDHWVQKSQVVPEHIKKEWKNVWDCLADEEENCYNQEGHDPEVETDELEDGWTYKSMRVIDDWVKSSK